MGSQFFHRFVLHLSLSSANTVKPGRYFVVGSQNRARLVALCHHKANSEEALNEFKASISAEAPEVGGIYRKLEFTNETNKYRVSTTVSVFVDGYGKSATDTVMLNTTEVDSTFKEFQRNTQPVPFVALLQHYNTLDERVPTPGEHFDRTSAKLSEAYQRIFFLQSRVISCPLVGSEGLAQEVADHFDDLRKNIHPDEKDWLEHFDVWSKKANELTQGFQQWQLRERLLKDSEKLSLEHWPTPNVNTESVIALEVF